MNHAFVEVADISQIKEGQRKVIYFRRKEVAIFNISGQFYALDNLCPHRGGPLSEGEVENFTVVCPLHGARFDARTGRGLKGPHRCDTRSYETRVIGSAIAIR